MAQDTRPFASLDSPTRTVPRQQNTPLMTIHRSYARPSETLALPKRLPLLDSQTLWCEISRSASSNSVDEVSTVLAPTLTLTLFWRPCIRYIFCQTPLLFPVFFLCGEHGVAPFPS